MTCYFHQNLAYIAFKTYDQMIATCQLRLYMEDDRLLTGRPRIARNFLDVNDSDTTQAYQQPKAMTFQSGSLPDFNINQQFSNQHIKPRKTSSQHNQTKYSQNASIQVIDDLTLAPHTGLQPQSQQYQRQQNHDHPQDDHRSKNPQQSPSSSKTLTTTSQLDLILAKLSELDTIKQHITTLDQRMNLLQPLSSILGLLAQRS